MADQRQPFRFRLPWLVTAPARAPAPAAAPQPPPAAVPQRPPLRPAGAAPPPPAQPPPTNQLPPPSPSRAGNQSRVTSPVPASPSRGVAPAQPPSPPAPSLPTTEAKPPSPSRVAAQSRVHSKLPASPSRRGTQSRVTSPVPAPPSRASPPSQTASQPASPSRSASQVRVASRSPSPSPAAPQPEPLSESTPQPISVPAVVSQQPPKEVSPPTSPHQIPAPVQPTVNPPSPSKTKTETKETIQPSSPETQPKAPKISETISDSGEQSQDKIVIQHDLTTTQPIQVLGDIKPDDQQTSAAATKISSQKLDSAASCMDLKPVVESQNKSEEAKAVAKTIQQEIIEERSEDLADGKPKQKADTELSSKQVIDGVNNKEQLSDELTFDKKEVLTTPGARRKPTETAIPTYPKVPRPLQKPPMSNGEKAPMHKEIKEEVSKFVHKLGVSQPNQPLDEKPFNIITLAGENRGATMDLGSEPAKEAGSIHIHRGYKTDPDESIETTTDAEAASNGRKSGDQKAEEDMATMAYINSNVQGINNSVVFNSSVGERNPGVLLFFSRGLIESEKLKKDAGKSETRKAEFKITPSEKLTHAPTVRRRCLRALFLEPSDSDSDNPDKPRRHGCRYGCREKGKDNEDIL